MTRDGAAHASRANGLKIQTNFKEAWWWWWGWWGGGCGGGGGGGGGGGVKWDISDTDDS